MFQRGVLNVFRPFAKSAKRKIINHKFTHLLYAIMCEQNTYMSWKSCLMFTTQRLQDTHRWQLPVCVGAYICVWLWFDHFHILFYLFFLVYFFLVGILFFSSFVSTSKWSTSSLKWSIKKILQPIRFATVKWENKHKNKKTRNRHTHETRADIELFWVSPHTQSALAESNEFSYIRETNENEKKSI